MTGITFTVELDNAAIAARLDEMLGRMTNLYGFYKGVGEYIKDFSVKRNFANETGPDGSPWAKLSPVTIARREAKGQTPIRILRNSDSMAGGISYIPSDDGVRVGSPAIQAAVMQFGAAKGAFGAATGRTRPTEKRPKSQDYFVHLPWGDIPARPFLGISSEDEAKIIRLAEEWLEVE